jgi:hypothetical protein
MKIYISLPSKTPKVPKLSWKNIKLEAKIKIKDKR